MALIAKIEFGSQGWNIITYTDGAKFIGHTVDNEIREGLGTLYDSDGNILQRGEWLKDEFILPIETSEFDRILGSR